MFLLNRNKLLPMGIDIGHDAVRMVQLAVDRRGALRVTAAARRPLPEASSGEHRMMGVKEAIEAMLQLGELRGRSVVIAPPGDEVVTRTLRLPLGFSAAAGLIPTELRDAFDFDLSGAPLQVIHAGTVRQGLPEGEEVIALAMKSADAERLNGICRSVGLRGVTVMPRMIALHRTLCAVGGGKAGGASAVLDLGGDAARLLICREGKIQFLRSLPASSADLCRSLSRTLGITFKEAQSLRRRVIVGRGEVQDGHDSVRRAVGDAARATLEALAAEVARCLRYHAVTFRGQHATCIHLSGEEAADSQLHELLAAHCGLPVSIIEPFAQIDANSMRPADRAGGDGAWAVAVALAARSRASEFVSVGDPVGTASAAA